MNNQLDDYYNRTGRCPVDLASEQEYEPGTTEALLAEVFTACNRYVLRGEEMTGMGLVGSRVSRLLRDQENLKDNLAALDEALTWDYVYTPTMAITMFLQLLEPYAERLTNWNNFVAHVDEVLGGRSAGELGPVEPKSEY